MRTLCIGASWILKYTIGEILLKDTDDFEQEFVIHDRESTPENFFHFPPIAKYAGDERIIFGPPNPFTADCVIIDTNFIEDVISISKPLENSKARVIVISSGDVFGFQGRRQIPFDERSTLPMPTSQLGKTKAEIERIVQPLDNVVILRLSKIFGPYMPEDDEIIQWLTALLTNKPILVEQPAARAYDLCYITNVLPAIQKAMTADLKGERVINLGSADSDYKEENLQNPKAKRQVMIHQKHVVNMLVGLRHLLGSQSKIEISNENISVYQGKGFNSQLKTQRAREILDYFPMVDTQRGLFQTAYWLQKSGAVTGGRDMEILYPTLSEEGAKRVGLVLTEEEIKRERELERDAVKEVDLGLLCQKCAHIPTQPKQWHPPPKNDEYICDCQCHRPFFEQESTEALR